MLRIRLQDVVRLVAAAALLVAAPQGRAQSRSSVRLSSPGILRTIGGSSPISSFRWQSYGLGSAPRARPAGSGNALQSRLRASLSSSRNIRRTGGAAPSLGGGLDALGGQRSAGRGGLLGLDSAGVRLETGSSVPRPARGGSLTRGGERYELPSTASGAGAVQRPTLTGAAAYLDAVESLGRSLANRSEPVTSLIPENEGPLRRYLSAGEAALQDAAFAEAADQFELALARAPRSPEVLLNLVHAHFGQSTRSYAMAAYYLREALRYAPRLPAAPLRPREFFGGPAAIAARLRTLDAHVADTPGDANARLVLAYFRWFAREPELDEVRTLLAEALRAARAKQDHRTVTAVRIFWRGIGAAAGVDEPLEPTTPPAGGAG